MSLLLNIGNSHSHRLIRSLQKSLIASGYFDRDGVTLEHGEEDWVTLRARIRQRLSPGQEATDLRLLQLVLSHYQLGEVPFEVSGAKSDERQLTLCYTYWSTLNAGIDIEIKRPSRPVAQLPKSVEKIGAPPARPLKPIDTWDKNFASVIFEYVIFADEKKLSMTAADATERCAEAILAFQHILQCVKENTRKPRRG